MEGAGDERFPSVVAAFNALTNEFALQMNPDGRDIVEVFNRDPCDAKTALRCSFDEPDRAQAAQRFTQRRGPEPVAVSQVFNAQFFARREPAEDDVLAELAIG